MAGDTGQGQTFTFASTSIPNVRSIQVSNNANTIEEVVADTTLKQTMSTGWQFVVDFIAPTSATHTLEGAIKAGTSGAVSADSGATHYASSSGKSGGFTKSSPSNGFISYSLTVVIDGDPTMTAA